MSDMNGTEAVMHIVLDKQRNNLILFDLKANLITLAVASGTFVSSLFGMNLTTHLETSVVISWHKYFSPFNSKGYILVGSTWLWSSYFSLLQIRCIKTVEFKTRKNLYNRRTWINFQKE